MSAPPFFVCPYFTLILQEAVTVPDSIVITAVPFFFALIFPLGLTVATVRLEES